MRLASLSVSDFGAVESAQLDLKPGLNVLYGPNDLGKSTLAAAIRAALLLQHGSSAARAYVPWGTSRKPTVTLTFECRGQTWRVRKVFGASSGGTSVLERSDDGHAFSVQDEGRGVDGTLRELLGWGLAAPGGRGGSHGFPKSFLSTVLLGEQALPYRLLDQSLESDAEDSGRARLAEALEAMAADPLYQSVLEAAQARVDEAFTATGKRSTRKGSPFERVTAAIKTRREVSEALAAQVAQSDAVVARLAELTEVRARRLEQRDEAARACAALEAAAAAQQARAQLAAEARNAQAALEDFERDRDAIARLCAAVAEAERAVPEHERRVAEAAEAARGAHADRSRAAAAVEAVRRGEDAGFERDVRAAHDAIAGIEARAKTLEDRRARLSAWATQHAAAAEAAATYEAAQRAVDAAVSAQGRAEAVLDAAAADHAAWTHAATWSELRDLEAALTAGREALARAEVARADARGKRAQAEARLADLAGPFPAAATRAAMREAWDNLRMREAALGGGVRVSLDIEPSRGVEAAVDGADARGLEPRARLDAERAVEVSVAGVGSIVVEAGDVRAHNAVEAARARWQAEGASVLAELGLDSLEALEARAREREQVRAEADALRNAADLLEARVPAGEGVDAAGLGSRAQLARRALATADVEAARARAERAGPALDAQRRAAEAARGAAAQAVAQAEARTAEARVELRVLEERWGSATRRAAEARPGAVDPEAGPAACIAALEAKMAVVQRDLAAACAARDELEARRAGREAAAARVLESAVEATARADAVEAAERARLATARDSATAAQAELQVRQERAQRHDPLAAAERVARAQDALAAHPVPEVEVDDRAVERARAALAEAEQDLEAAETAVRQQQGALAHVGGQVVRERAQMALEALDHAQRAEAEVTLDYDGWRTLLATLREVENETGAHLGRALGSSVAARFAELSGGRYQGPKLGVDLETQGVRTPHGVQELGRFSEGVKEQLATLIRVAVAEQLRCTLVLDDHLSQTDADRAQWFRQHLHACAASIQIVVFTCRPHDYLGDASDRVHAVDLAARLVEASPRP